MIKKVLLIILIIAIILVVFSYFKNNDQMVKKEVATDDPTDQIINLEEETKLEIDQSKKIFLEISEPKDNLTVSKKAVTVNGKTIINGYVFVNEQEFRAEKNGNFSTTVILDEGENYILVVVSDDFGNSVEKDILVTLESTQ